MPRLVPPIPAAVPAVLVLSVLDIVWTIVAAVRANEGVLWRYPYSMRLVT